MKNKYSDEEFIKICKEASTMSQACTILGYSSFNTFMRKAKKLGCYNPNQGSKGIKRKSKGIPVEDILAGKYPDYNTYKLKIKLIKAGIKEVLGTCVAVGITVDGKSPKEVTKDVNDGKYHI